MVEGRYTTQETKPAENYYYDDIPRTVEFIASKYTEMVWENRPKAEQIQVTKLLADANEVSGLEAGTPLEGAIFGVYEYKKGNIVDRFVTGYDGKGVSKPLPLGRYILKEEQAPPYFKLKSFTFYFGNVKAGFCNVEETKIYAKTLNKDFPNGYRFSNSAPLITA